MMVLIECTMSPYVWLRAIRVKFLLSSVISATLGGIISLYTHHTVDLLDLLLVIFGVMALHASVDLLNDYRDYKRGIDTKTKKTGMSGGTGVLPEGLLAPNTVYRAGILCLLVGGAVGVYYIYTHGVVVGIILGFAILSIYFYSTKIVDWGLGETFVGIKGALIVLGSYYIQTTQLNEIAILAGAAAGSLSAFVLYMTSFPDHDADKSGGRKTLVIRLGPVRAARLCIIFPTLFIAIILYGIYSDAFPIYCMISLFSIPFGVLANKNLRRDHVMPKRQMRYALIYSRISGVLLIIGFAIPAIIATLEVV